MRGQGNEGVSGIKAMIIEAPPGMNIIDGEVVIGGLDSTQYIIPEDGFTLSVEKGTWPAGQPLPLKWQLEYIDSSGQQQRMVDTISTF